MGGRKVQFSDPQGPLLDPRGLLFHSVRCPPPIIFASPLRDAKPTMCFFNLGVFALFRPGELVVEPLDGQKRIPGAKLPPGKLSGAVEAS